MSIASSNSSNSAFFRSPRIQSESGRSLRQTLLIALAVIVFGLASAAIIATPLGLRGQVIFGATTIGLLLVLRSSGSRRTTLVLTLLSIAISTRYIYWRTTETLNFDSPLGGVLGTGLYLAELYAWLILILSYVQSIWPLERKPVPLPQDATSWPTVDVYIPTYNESLSVVADTVLAALNMDYPADKMRVFLLDDGRREEFRAFAEEVGCEYITRPDNKHAKAGNLNHAMQLTNGEYVCIFDCDHVPTRAFLQLTLGWLVKDPEIALIQTPHHFYSPEPFQRNTPQGKKLPSEGELFYGIIQPGNDFWNAAYFCGSCAVIRRQALDQVGGFAGETVTEDAHSALKMQKLGWKTAYINIPLAAGLATEKLALHVGQRIRWARGMTQIFRLDNPMFGGKMKLMPRLCYLNAILHFQFPLARLVFLTSPLAYLFLGQSVITSSAALIAAYALPHLIHNWFTNARLEGRYRHAFWGEVYEVALCFHLLRPTLSTLLSPHKGKFNVTDKGGLLDYGYFDWRLVLPHIVVASLLIAGVLFGLARVYLWPGFFPIDSDTMWLNTGWSVFNLIILFAAIAVALESRQIRRHVRFAAKIPVSIHLADKTHFEATTSDISMGGVAIKVRNASVIKSPIIGIVMPCGGRKAAFPVRRVDARDGALTLQFGAMTPAERRDLVMAVMGRANAWIDDSDHIRQGVLVSLGSLIRVGVSLLAAIFRKRKVRRPGAATRGSLAGGTLAPATVAARVRAASIVLAIGVSLCTLFLAGRAFASPADLGFDGAGIAGATETFNGTNRTVDLSLKDLGAGEPVKLSQAAKEVSYPLTLRHDEVVTRADLSLTLSYPHSDGKEAGDLTVLANGEPGGEIKAPPTPVKGPVTVDVHINPILLLTSNRLAFRFSGGDGGRCITKADASHWVKIENTDSVLRLTVSKLTLAPELARLPAPFFDPGDMTSLDLPFVYASEPSESELLASATIASYFGSLASYRGFHFAPSIATIPSGNAVVIATAGESIPGLKLPTVTGPTLAVQQNPIDPSSDLLLVLGRNGKELRAAADALAAGKKRLSGTIARVEAPDLPRRVADDAPRWLATGKKIPLSSMPHAALSLDGKGLRQGVLTADFRIPPDIFVWPNHGLPLNINYRYPTGAWLNSNTSKLDVQVNNQYLKSFPLSKTKLILASLFGTNSLAKRNYAEATSRVVIPPYLLFGQNQIQFYFNLDVNRSDACNGSVPKDIRTSVSPDTTLSLTHVHHFTRMPNLAFFASAGFPFTKFADLSHTVAVLSLTPDVQTITAFLDLMGRFGDSTGVPATGLSISHGQDISALKDKDVLVLGSVSDVEQLSPLMANAPIRQAGGDIVVRNPGSLRRLVSDVIPTSYMRDKREADRLMRSSGGFELMTSFRSPVDPKHLVVALVAKPPFGLPDLVHDLDRRSKNAKVQGDLTIWSNEGISAFSFGPTFWTGDAPLVTRVLWYLSQNPLVMAFGLVISMIALSLPIYAVLRRHARDRIGGEDV